MTHDLYKTGDPDVPEEIEDRNGEVVLSMCKLCGLAEAELDAPCSPNWKFDLRVVDETQIKFVQARPLQTCRVCGCDDWDCSGCIAKTGAACSWVTHDLCSACSADTAFGRLKTAMDELLYQCGRAVKRKQISGVAALYGVERRWWGLEPNWLLRKRVLNLMQRCPFRMPGELDDSFRARIVRYTQSTTNR